jgi:asparagine synthase (glutamine-hydrolysing)
MSGIMGIYYRDERLVAGKDLEQMVKVLTHRGPDGAGIWYQGLVGLGHCMLWTTAESLNEKLPLVSQTGNVVLTADARIDNRDELISILNLDDRLSTQFTDSELILAAYEKWGECCPEKLLGDFAFALWDSHKQQLFCARDPFGVKPFYYYLSEQTFIFASEIKALFSLTEAPRRLNEVRVLDYLTSMLNDNTITFYQDILRLPPAHSLTINQKGESLQAYWALDPSQALHLASDEAYAEAFCELFTKAVDCRLRRALPIGSLLSGGLDSSSVTCIARQRLVQNSSEQLSTFSAIFDEVRECDERLFINTVLAQGSLKSYYVHADQMSPLIDLERIFWHQDEAFFAPNLFMRWSLYGVANQQGIRSLLDGFDGDNTVSHGFGYLKELARAGHWLALAINMRGLAKAHYMPSFWSYLWYCGLEPIFSHFRIVNRVRRLWQSRFQPLLPQANKFTDRPVWTTPLNPNFVQRIGLRERYRDWKRTQPGLAQTEREWHYRSIKQGALPFALEVLDKAAAAFSIEPRYPFWDRRLVEFCLALPANQKLHQGWSRLVLRRAMNGILPSEIQWRKDKLNFLPNFSRGLLLFERKRLDELILKDLGLIEEYIDVMSLRKIYLQFISNQSKTKPYDVSAIWTVISLALWLKHTGITP